MYRTYYILQIVNPDKYLSEPIYFIHFNMTPYWFVSTWILKNQVGKINFDELQKSISKLIFAGYTGSKNQVWNRPSNLIFTTWLFKNQVQMDRANRKVSKPQWGQILHEIVLEFFTQESLCDNYVPQWWVELVVY